MLNTLRGTDQTRNVAEAVHLHYEKQSVFKTVLPAGLRVTGKVFVSAFSPHEISASSLTLSVSQTADPIFNSEILSISNALFTPHYVSN